MAVNPLEMPLLAGQPSLADGRKLFLATVRLQAQAYKAVMSYQIEILNFLRHRYERDMKVVDDLVASDDFSDAFDVMSSFVQVAATDYTSEAGRIANIGSKLSSETARRMRKQANELIEDVAAKTVA